MGTRVAAVSCQSSSLRLIAELLWDCPCACAGEKEPGNFKAFCSLAIAVLQFTPVISIFRAPFSLPYGERQIPLRVVAANTTRKFDVTGTAFGVM